MSYSVITTTDDGHIIYGTNSRSCIGIDKEFQQWLRENAGNLPAEIQAKIDAGELTIQDAE